MSSEILFRLKQIREEEFYYDGSSIKSIKDFDDDKISIGIGLDFGYDLEAETISIYLKFNYLYQSGKHAEEFEVLKKEDNDVEFLRFSFESLFEVNNLQSVLKEKEDKSVFHMPNDVMLTMVNVGIGTGRGILYSKTAGVEKINDFFLPIVDTQKLIEVRLSSLKSSERKKSVPKKKSSKHK